MKTKQLPTTARLMADHAKWYAQVNKTARAIANHVITNQIGDPVLAKLTDEYRQLTKDKPVREDP